MLPTACRLLPPRTRRALPIPLPLTREREHTFPPFYACYVLRSLGTRPRGRTSYIGSTPDPVRRLRQHNGELAQGARKTALDRPWVLALLIHGFPSRLHALQFEWALQHPWKSRHLALHFPSRAGRAQLDRIVHVARTMISTPPYAAWPLHVHLFTPSARSAWRSLSPTAPAPLPPRALVTLTKLPVSRAGVQDVSALNGALDVADEAFREMVLKKETALEAEAEAEGVGHTCSVCRAPVDVTDALTTALCPAGACTGLAHLACLARHFSQSQALLPSEPKSNSKSKARGKLTSTSTSAPAPPLLPRLGTCPTCNAPVLWGDVVRACYHRHRRRAGELAASGELLDGAELEMDELVEGAVGEPGLHVRVLGKRKRGRPSKADMTLPAASLRAKTRTTKPKPKPKLKAKTMTNTRAVPVRRSAKGPATVKKPVGKRAAKVVQSTRATKAATTTTIGAKGKASAAASTAVKAVRPTRTRKAAAKAVVSPARGTARAKSKAKAKGTTGTATAKFNAASKAVAGKTQVKAKAKAKPTSRSKASAGSKTTPVLLVRKARTPRVRQGEGQVGVGLGASAGKAATAASKPRKARVEAAVNKDKDSGAGDVLAEERPKRGRPRKAVAEVSEVAGLSAVVKRGRSRKVVVAVTEVAKVIDRVKRGRPRQLARG